MVESENSKCGCRTRESVAAVTSASLKAPLQYLVLTAHIPHCETDVLVLNGLHVKPCTKQGDVQCPLAHAHMAFADQY